MFHLGTPLTSTNGVIFYTLYSTLLLCAQVLDTFLMLHQNVLNLECRKQPQLYQCLWRDFDEGHASEGHLFLYRSGGI